MDPTSPDFHFWTAAFIAYVRANPAAGITRSFGADAELVLAERAKCFADHAVAMRELAAGGDADAP
jgi:hypothetical protein